VDKPELVSLKRALLKDKRMLKLHDAFTTLPQYQLNIAELYDEVKTIHALRKTRQLNTKNKNFIRDLIDGMIDDGAKRSRLVEILMVCVKTIRTLEDTLESLEGYLLMEYSTKLYQLKTKGERADFIKHHVFQPYLKYSKRLSTLKDAVELVCVDIDKFAYSYRNLVEAAKLSSTKVDQL